jgi:hypothetical protein
MPPDSVWGIAVRKLREIDLVDVMKGFLVPPRLLSLRVLVRANINVL